MWASFSLSLRACGSTQGCLAVCRVGISQPVFVWHHFHGSPRARFHLRNDTRLSRGLWLNSGPRCNMEASGMFAVSLKSCFVFGLSSVALSSRREKTPSEGVTAATTQHLSAVKAELPTPARVPLGSLRAASLYWGKAWVGGSDQVKQIKNGPWACGETRIIRVRNLKKERKRKKIVRTGPYCAQGTVLRLLHALSHFSR